MISALRWGLREGLELTPGLWNCRIREEITRHFWSGRSRTDRMKRLRELPHCRNDLQQFFAEYGEVPETQNYLAALHELAGKCRQRQLLLEKQKKYLQQKQKYEALAEQD